MTSKKKHLKYRATKSQAGPTSTKSAALTTKTPPVAASAKPLSVKQVRIVEPHSLLTAEQQAIVKKELWHIVFIALGILALYAVLWYGFHYLGWNDVILRLVPNGK